MPTLAFKDDFLQAVVVLGSVSFALTNHDWKKIFSLKNTSLQRVLEKTKKYSMVLI